LVILPGKRWHQNLPPQACRPQKVLLGPSGEAYSADAARSRLHRRIYLPEHHQSSAPGRPQPNQARHLPFKSPKMMALRMPTAITATTCSTTANTRNPRRASNEALASYGNEPLPVPGDNQYLKLIERPRCHHHHRTLQMAFRPKVSGNPTRLASSRYVPSHTT
jgi:hypothetical protein